MKAHTQDTEHYNVILELTGDQLPFRDISHPKRRFKMLSHFSGGKKENPSQQASNVALFLLHQKHFITSKNSLWVTPDTGQM